MKVDKSKYTYILMFRLCTGKVTRYCVAEDAFVLDKTTKALQPRYRTDTIHVYVDNKWHSIDTDELFEMNCLPINDGNWYTFRMDDILERNRNILKYHIIFEEELKAEQRSNLYYRYFSTEPNLKNLKNYLFKYNLS